MLVVGVAYKPDIDDTRESPALKLIELLRDEGCAVSYHDPHVPRLREFGLESVALDPAIESSDCVVVVTDHSSHRLRRPRASARGSSSTSATPPGRRARPNGKVVKL